MARLSLSEVRLQDDARWPWLVLIPRVANARELDDLEPDGLSTLTGEILAAGRAVRAIGAVSGRPVEKLNVGALGNIAPQLHVHVVGRRADDPAWPGPVWGFGAGESYAANARAEAIATARRALGIVA